VQNPQNSNQKSNKKMQTGPAISFNKSHNKQPPSLLSSAPVFDVRHVTPGLHSPQHAQQSCSYEKEWWKGAAPQRNPKTTNTKTKLDEMIVRSTLEMQETKHAASAPVKSLPFATQYKGGYNTTVSQLTTMADLRSTKFLS
jgi:hypothetical protein